MRKKKLDSNIEVLKRDFGVRFSQYGTCPHCKQFASQLDYWVFNEKWKTIHMGFACLCGTKWEENYKIEPLPINMDDSKL